MVRGKSRTLLILALLVVVAAAARMFWTAFHTATGREFLAIQWQDAVTGWFGRGHEPIQDQEPAEQAEFWLSEVDRILEREQPSADLEMGAALVLDSPGLGFYSRHLRGPDPEHLWWAAAEPQLAQPQLDEVTINAALLKFEERCAADCLEHAARATALAPQDARWWRLRALLLFHNPPFGNVTLQPRTPNWADELERAAGHDPDNALYDYLAAVRFWHANADYDWDGKGYKLQISNEDEFRQGTLRFKRGLERKALNIGEAGYSTVTDFLRHASIPKSEQAHVALSRLIEFRSSVLLMRLMRWQHVRADQLRLSGDTAGAAALWRQFLRVTRQLLAANESLGSGGGILVYRHIAIANLRELVEESPDTFSDKELEALKEASLDLGVRRKVLEAADERLEQQREESDGPASVAHAAASGFGLTFAVLLLPFGILGLLTARWLLRGSRATYPPFRTVRHIVSWIVGCGLPFAVFGLAPARVISQDVQQAIVYVLAWVPAAVLLVWLVRKAHRASKQAREAGGVSGRSRLVVVAVWALAVVLLVTLGLLKAVVELLGDLLLLLPPVSLLAILLLPVVALLLWIRYLATTTKRTGRVPISHLGLVGLLTLSAAVLWPVLIACHELLSDLLSGVAMPVRSFAGLPAESLRIAVGAEEGSWMWVFLQWAAYPTLYISLGLSLLIVALWFAVRSARSHGEGWAKFWVSGPRQKWGGLLACVSRSALALGSIGLFLYLTTAPTLIQAAEREYQFSMSCLQDPESYWSKVQETVSEIEADPELMQRFRRQVRQELVEKKR